VTVPPVAQAPLPRQVLVVVHIAEEDIEEGTENTLIPQVPPVAQVPHHQAQVPLHHQALRVPLPRQARPLVAVTIGSTIIAGIGTTDITNLHPLQVIHAHTVVETRHHPAPHPVPHLAPHPVPQDSNATKSTNTTDIIVIIHPRPHLIPHQAAVLLMPTTTNEAW